LRPYVRPVLILVAILVALVLLTLIFIRQSTGVFYVFEGRDAHASQVALVLGASVWHGEQSQILLARTDAAIALYKAEKVSKILVTGDNGALNHDEVTPVRKYLIDAGVPAGDIFSTRGLRHLQLYVPGAERVPSHIYDHCDAKLPHPARRIPRPQSRDRVVRLRGAGRNAASTTTFARSPPRLRRSTMFLRVRVPEYSVLPSLLPVTARPRVLMRHMKIFPRTQFGNPILRAKAKMVPLSFLKTAQFKKLQRRMIYTMRRTRRRGNRGSAGRPKPPHRRNGDVSDARPARRL